MLTQHTTVFFVRLPCISIPYPAKKSPTAVFGCFGFYKADDDARLTPCKEDNAVKGKTHNISGRFGYLLLRYPPDHNSLRCTLQALHKGKSKSRPPENVCSFNGIKLPLCLPLRLHPVGGITTAIISTVISLALSFPAVHTCLRYTDIP